MEKENVQKTTASRVSLHKCRAVNLTVERGTLDFFIPDGIWMDGQKTGPARVIYALTGEPVIYVFEDGMYGETVRTLIRPEKLAGKLSKGKWVVEFGYRYDNPQEAFITGWLRRTKKKKKVELMMFLPVSNTYYQTN